MILVQDLRGFEPHDTTAQCAGLLAFVTEQTLLAARSSLLNAPSVAMLSSHKGYALARYAETRALGPSVSLETNMRSAQVQLSSKPHQARLGWDHLQLVIMHRVSDYIVKTRVARRVNPRSVASLFSIRPSFYLSPRGIAHGPRYSRCE